VYITSYTTANRCCVYKFEADVDSKFINNETRDCVIMFDEPGKVNSGSHIPSFRCRVHSTKPKEALEEEERLVSYPNKEARSNEAHDYVDRRCATKYKTALVFSRSRAMRWSSVVCDEAQMVITLSLHFNHLLYVLPKIFIHLVLATLALNCVKDYWDVYLIF